MTTWKICGYKKTQTSLTNLYLSLTSWHLGKFWYKTMNLLSILRGPGAFPWLPTTTKHWGEIPNPAFNFPQLPVSSKSKSRKRSFFMPFVLGPVVENVGLKWSRWVPKKSWGLFFYTPKCRFLLVFLCKDQRKKIVMYTVYNVYTLSFSVYLMNKKLTGGNSPGRFLRWKP